MTTLADLRPGDIGFGPIHGGAGLLVSAGQLALGEGFRVGGLDVRHVFVVTEPGSEGSVAVPICAEATPSGARQYPIGERWSSDYAYVRLPEDYPGQAGDAAAVARAMIGTPYSFASYGALALWRAGLKTPKLEAWIGRRKAMQQIEPWSGSPDSVGVHTVARYVALPCEAICSVLADQAWSLTGKKIMQGVAHQCVTPGALAGRLLSMPGAVWMWPGRDS